jgi:hypothetical protein
MRWHIICILIFFGFFPKFVGLGTQLQSKKLLIYSKELVQFTCSTQDHAVIIVHLLGLPSKIMTLWCIQGIPPALSRSCGIQCRNISSITEVSSWASSHVSSWVFFTYLSSQFSMMNNYYPNLVYWMFIILVACFHKCPKKKCQIWQEIKSIKWVKKKLEMNYQVYIEKLIM